MLALEGLVIALSLWMMWVMISEASRAPADPFSAVKHPPECPLAQALEPPLEAEDEDFPARFTLKEADERGYVSSRKLHMGCEAAVCRTPFGARIVAGKCSLKQPQYAWDYASVQQAHKALVHAKFSTDSKNGIVASECYPAAEPDNYLRRWRYTTDGQMERF